MMRKTGFWIFAAMLSFVMASVVCFAGANGGKMQAAPPSGLTAADVQFLSGQCNIGQPDIDVIPKLSEDTQQKLQSLISRRDCALLQPYIASRNYYRQLMPKMAIPRAPAGWNIAYLTKDELQHYADIMDQQPW
ncbi:MAG: hypothetical protein ABSF16_08140 [Terracidiphilus sp.]|jgi:hypothetical protein